MTNQTRDNPWKLGTGPYVWVCTCPTPAPDALGECMICHRLVRDKAHVRA